MTADAPAKRDKDNHADRGKRPFDREDIYLEQRISELNLVAGQPIAACTVRQAVKDQDEYRSVLWTFSLDGSDGRQLTWGPGLDEAPRWSPDGHTIAFLSDRAGGKPQIHLIKPSGGEAHALTNLECGVQELSWRPDGRQLLASCGVAVDPDQREHGADAPDPNRPERDPALPEIIWRLPYKMDGEGHVLGKRIHLFPVDAQSGKASPLTRGDFDVNSATWSPDGRHIAYSATRTEPGKEHCTDLWMLEVGDAGPAGQPRRLTHEQSNVSSPSWSPDGRWIVFSGSLEAGDAQSRLWLCEAETGGVQPLGHEDLEVVSAGLHWQQDSRRVAFVQVHRGIQRVAMIGVPDGKLSALDTGQRQVAQLAANDAGLAFTLESPAEPLELHSAHWDGDDQRQLSHLNGWWSERLRPEVVLRRFEVPDGDGGQEQIDGWLLLPPGHKGPSPLLVDVHGGPASYAGLEFPTHAYWQILCSRGWAVLALNPVGSSSYGRAFAARLRARWGELDLPQQLAAIKALQSEHVADERVAIAGSSYGGYLSAWAIGTSDVFRAAVVCAPVGNLETHFGTSDSGYYADPYSMEGKPDEDRELMFRLSPMAHVEKARTPTLFLQGKEDERCPKCQSEEMFVKLRTAGDTPAQLVMYPGGSHHVFGQGRPSHRTDILRRIVDWLERWTDQPLKPRPNGKAAQHRPGEAPPTPAPPDGRNKAEDLAPAGIGGRAMAQRAAEEPEGALMPGASEHWRGA
jgi:dipeptidyl aminopeptidase/acylaminoacyl peptidase